MAEQTINMDALDAAIRRLESERLPPKQRLRTIAQGLTLGAAEEIEAAARNPISAASAALGLGGEDYYRTLAGLRGKLSSYREAYPKSSLGYELGGGMIPAAGMVLAAPFTGGASLAGVPAAVGGAATRTGAREVARRAGSAALTGAAGGGAAAFLGGEGGFGERAANVPGAAAAGAVLGPVGQEAIRAVGGAATGVVDFARTRLGARGGKVVENEIQRLVEESGMTPDEIVAGVASGRLMAENKTLQMAARGYFARGGLSQSIMTAGISGRPAKTMAEAKEEIRTYLSSVEDENVLRAVRMSDAEAKAAERTAYAQFADMPASDDLRLALGAALRRVPASADEVTEALRAETGKAPFFKILDNGEIEFTREPTVLEAENVRRAIKNIVDQRYMAGRGAAAEAIAGVESELRAALDTIPELAATRASAASVRAGRDAFKKGGQAFTKSSDEIEIEFAQISDNPDLVEAYRNGVMNSILSRLETRNRASFVSALSNPETKEGRILRTIYPEEGIQEAIRMLERAAGATSAERVITQGSATAGTMAQMQRQGMSLGAEDVMGAISGDPFALARAASKIAKDMGNMTDAQAAQVARILVSEDPRLVARALRDQSALAQLQLRAAKLREALSVGAGFGAAVTAAPPVGEATSGLFVGPR